MPFDAIPASAVSVPISAASGPVAALLERALQRLEAGWCQGASARDVMDRPICDIYETDRHIVMNPVKFCMMGSVRIEEISTTVTPEQANLAYDLLEKAIMNTASSPPSPLSIITQWNDTPGRTKTEVVEHVQQAIKWAKLAGV